MVGKRGGCENAISGLLSTWRTTRRDHRACLRPSFANISARSNIGRSERASERTRVSAYHGITTSRAPLPSRMYVFHPIPPPLPPPRCLMTIVSFLLRFFLSSRAREPQRARIRETRVCISATGMETRDDCRDSRRNRHADGERPLASASTVLVSHS